MIEACDPGAYKLMHEGALALTDVEHNGIRIDTDYLEKTMEETGDRLRSLEKELKTFEHWKLIRKKYQDRSNLAADEQIAHVLFTEMDYPVYEYTKKGKPSTDVSALERIDDPFVTLYSEWKQLFKAHGTFLTGIKRETIDGFLHPVFNLHTTKTYRSSSDAPNFQNFPARNKVISGIVRRCFIPRKGHQLIEIDYGGIEVMIAACYHKDPTCIHDILHGDMHRDMASEIFMCKPEQVGKMERYVSKNRFVFPEFYGSYWASCAPSLWEAMGLMNLSVDMVPMKEWLARKGITRLGGEGKTPPPGSFMAHVKQVEYGMWKRRYKVYDQWKRDWYENYLQNGWYKTLSGFVIKGIYGKNNVINHPVQGSAFHCLLWSLIELNKELRKRKMKSKIVGQIHDSIVADVHTKERDDFLELAYAIMVHRLMRAWTWVQLKLRVEAEACPVGGTWFDKEEIEIGYN